MALLTSRHDIVDVLTSDHQEVRRLLKRLPKAEGTEAHDLFMQIKHALEVHTKVEEETVYPEFRQCVGDHDAKVLVHESLLEHAIVDRVLAELESLRPGTAEFEGKATVLREMVEHHAKDEEKEMFPKFRKHCARETLQRLGQRVVERKTMLQRSGPMPAGGQAGALGKLTKEELYERAKKAGVDGRSRMDKDELVRALKRR